MQFPGNVISVRIFGSVARGDHDESSDADILVVVKDRSGKVPEGIVSEYVQRRLGKVPTVSWYGLNRLKKMFAGGHLFAWHLYRESQQLWGPNEISDLFGKPAPYEDALDDISSFQQILLSVPTALQRCPRNALYEMGLLYVCVRNIAMSASWHLCGEPDFTRYSPFACGLGNYAARDEYTLSMSCRMAGQRGLPLLDDVAWGQVLRFQKAAIVWSQHIVTETERHVRQE